MYAIHSFCFSMWLLENLSEVFSPTSTSGRLELHLGHRMEIFFGLVVSSLLPLIPG